MLRAPGLQSALLPVLGLLRIELNRLGLSLGDLQSLGPKHEPMAGYSRREWRYSLIDRSLEEASARDVVLALEFTFRGAGEGRATLLVEERPPELSSFDRSRRCRSRRLMVTPAVSSWWDLPDPVEGMLATFDASGLLNPLAAVRSEVLTFVQGFQP